MSQLKKIKVIFFGTSEFAVPILNSLNQNFDLVAVVTQPDRPVGRKQEIISTPVKATASDLGVKILQFETLKSDDVINQLKEFGAELFVVAAYGKIIPQIILEIPSKGSINVHGSVLPNYRGASPIHAVLLNGDSKTGNTIMIMDAEMDHGPILATSAVEIESNDDFKSLEKKMSENGAKLLIETLSDYLDGKITRQEQNHELATYTKLISKEDGKIDWNKSADEIINQWRAFKYWPSIHSYFTDKNGKKLKVILNIIKKAPSVDSFDGGTITLKQGQMLISVGESSIEVMELTPEGSKTMTAKEFANGYMYLNGQKFE